MPQLQAEVEVFRASHAAAGNPRPSVPSTQPLRDLNSTTGPTEGIFADVIKGSASKKKVLGYQGPVPVSDKENQGAGGVLADNGDTAPPFRSLNEDDTLQANQCRQS